MDGPGIYTTPHHPKVNSQMQVYALRGHTKPLTKVKYNRDGDLLFSASKNDMPSAGGHERYGEPTLWRASDGERLGTYGPHRGTVWDLDPSWDSAYLLTAGGDAVARMFEVTTGKFILRMPHRGPVRAVAWSETNDVYATASDPFRDTDDCLISIFNLPKDVINAGVPAGSDPPAHIPTSEIRMPASDKATTLGWTYGNEGIVAGFDSGKVSIFDPETQAKVLEAKVHKARVQQLSFNNDKTLIVTGSKDNSACLVDPRTLTVVKTFPSSVPINGAIICPQHPHIIIGGGQDAQNVTTTSAAAGKFEARFFHMAYGDEIASVKGHFGPINTLAIDPQGASYASGSEDGYVRLHIFDKSYLTMPDYLPKDIRK